MFRRPPSRFPELAVRVRACKVFFQLFEGVDSDYFQGHVAQSVVPQKRLSGGDEIGYLDMVVDVESSIGVRPNL
jgi:hypothetical protein